MCLFAFTKITPYSTDISILYSPIEAPKVEKKAPAPKPAPVEEKKAEPAPAPAPKPEPAAPVPAPPAPKPGMFFYVLYLFHILQTSNLIYLSC